jgi:hypothetical protein
VEIDKKRIRTLDETDEPAPIDQVEERVEAEMKRIHGKAKEQVASGLSDANQAKKGRQMKEHPEGELRQLREDKSKK